VPVDKPADKLAAKDGGAPADAPAPAAKVAAKGGGGQPSKMKATMVGVPSIELPKPPVAPSAERTTVPTGGGAGARASSLPPLPRTGLGGKQLGMIAVAIVVVVAVLVLLMR